MLYLCSLLYSFISITLNLSLNGKWITATSDNINETNNEKLFLFSFPTFLAEARLYPITNSLVTKLLNMIDHMQKALLYFNAPSIFHSKLTYHQDEIGKWDSVYILHWCQSTCNRIFFQLIQHFDFLHHQDPLNTKMCK